MVVGAILVSILYRSKLRNLEDVGSKCSCRLGVRSKQKNDARYGGVELSWIDVVSKQASQRRGW